MDLVSLLIGLLVGGTIAWFVSSLMMKLKMVSKDEHESAIQKSNQLQTDIELAKQKTISFQQEKTEFQNEIYDYKLKIDLLQKDIHAKDRDISTLTANLDAARESSINQLQDLNQQKLDLKAKTEEYNELNKITASFTANNKALEEKLNTQKVEMEDLRKQFN
ncbi:MAG: DNA recombination protein RmuC, partial [Bacteroidales bacterium]|nr:DNA recombination protein RmuC [Bacteroidales bacterium]